MIVLGIEVLKRAVEDDVVQITNDKVIITIDMARMTDISIITALLGHRKEELEAIREIPVSRRKRKKESEHHNRQSRHPVLLT